LKNIFLLFLIFRMIQILSMFRFSFGIFETLNLARLAHIDAALLIIITIVSISSMITYWLLLQRWWRCRHAQCTSTLSCIFFSPSSLSILVPSPPKMEKQLSYYRHYFSILNLDDSDELTKFDTVNPHNEDKFHWRRSKVPLPQSSDKVTSVGLILFLLVKWQYVLLISNW